MVKLKIFFITGVVVSILVMCAFVPGICIDRFVLPDGCCTDCGTSVSSCCNVCAVDIDENCWCRQTE